jgi:predicted Rossmann fold flavoprotein
MTTTVCIIGAGPAGLMAAIAAAGHGARTVLLEKNTTAGRKLLKTGRGRCNLTHEGTIDDFVRAMEPFGRFLKPSLYEFGPDQVRRFFLDRQLALKTEKDGCLFPITDRATDVLRILIDTARRANVAFAYGRTVERVEAFSGGFRITTAPQTFEADAVIIATGGKSWSFTGSTGDGWRLAETFGHTITPPRPAVCPVVTQESWPGDLQGTALPFVRLAARINSRRETFDGPLMFTGEGLGGPVAFDLSRAVTDTVCGRGQPVPITLDLYPAADAAEMDQWLIGQCAANPRRELAGLLSVRFPRSLSIRLEKFISPDLPVIAGHFSKDQRRQLVRLIKEMPLTVCDLAPLEQATVTRGGVALDEIDAKTLQSKRRPGLFFAGEVIDADGPCGGYNLQIAWSTGALAGRCAAQAGHRQPFVAGE